MRIIILADTHNYLPTALKAVKDTENVDLILHLGDNTDDAKRISAETGIPYKAVRGNRDWHSDAPYIAFWEFEGIKIMALHGHLEDISRNEPEEERHKKFKNLAEKAKMKNACIVLYGHDHLAEKFYIDDILFFNPGELVYGAKNSSYGVLEIKDGVFSIEHFYFGEKTY
ncbi:MAG: YfcE family phosphodiesterase [Spirochaetes bacterium]|nr:YfcE family phosphodiesterase [Spirochaetota bacterium]